MKLTRDQIEALREGVTEEPWRVEFGKYGAQIWSGRHWLANLKCESCPAHEEANANIFAAAPNLADTALAALDRVAELEAALARETLGTELALRNMLSDLVSRWDMALVDDDDAEVDLIALAKECVAIARAALEPQT